MKYLGLVVSVLAVVLTVVSFYERNTSALNGWLCTVIWAYSYFLKVKDE